MHNPWAISEKHSIILKYTFFVDIMLVETTTAKFEFVQAHLSVQQTQCECPDAPVAFPPALHLDLPRKEHMIRTRTLLLQVYLKLQHLKRMYTSKY